jgi:hypothetical protein
MNNLFEVLSPWANADAVSLKGISERVTGLAGKKIGLFHHTKLAGPPILAVVERKLKERYPTAEFSYFRFSRTGDIEDRFDRIGLPEDAVQEGLEKDRFEDWVKGVDAVVGAVGD